MNSSARLVIRHFEMPLDIVLVGTISYLTIFIIGLIGNLITIYVLTRKNFSNFTNYLLANLSIADIMTLLICIPTGLHDLYAKERWYLGRIMCYLILFFENTLGFASILSIFFISMERFYVVCRPLRAKSIIYQRRTLKLIILIWFTAIIVNIPLIFMSEYKLKTFHDRSTSYKCIANTMGQGRQFYSFFVTFVIYLIIGIMLIYIFKQMAKHLKQSNGDLISNIQPDDSFIMKNELTAYGNDPFSKRGSIIARNPRLSINMNLQKYIKPRKRLILILKLIIMMFYLSLFPLKIWNIILMLFGHKPGFRRVIGLRQYWYINITLRIFFYINSSINPILFNCLSSKFRRGCQNILIKKKARQGSIKSNSENFADRKLNSLSIPDNSIKLQEYKKVQFKITNT